MVYNGPIFPNDFVSEVYRYVDEQRLNIERYSNVIVVKGDMFEFSYESVTRISDI